VWYGVLPLSSACFQVKPLLLMLWRRRFKTYEQANDDPAHAFSMTQ